MATYFPTDVLVGRGEKSPNVHFQLVLGPKCPYCEDTYDENIVKTKPQGFTNMLTSQPQCLHPAECHQKQYMYCT